MSSRPAIAIVALVASLLGCGRDGAISLAVPSSVAGVGVECVTLRAYRSSSLRCGDVRVDAPVDAAAVAVFEACGRADLAGMPLPSEPLTVVATATSGCAVLGFACEELRPGMDARITFAEASGHCPSGCTDAPCAPLGCGETFSSTDRDGDGLRDVDERIGPFPIDSDGDAISDECDVDSDGDGAFDGEECESTTPDCHAARDPAVTHCGGVHAPLTSDDACGRCGVRCEDLSCCGAGGAGGGGDAGVDSRRMTCATDLPYCAPRESTAFQGLRVIVDGDEGEPVMIRLVPLHAGDVTAVERVLASSRGQVFAMTGEHDPMQILRRASTCRAARPGREPECAIVFGIEASVGAAGSERCVRSPRVVVAANFSGTLQGFLRPSHAQRIPSVTRGWRVLRPPAVPTDPWVSVDAGDASVDLRAIATENPPTDCTVPWAYMPDV